MKGRGIQSWEFSTGQFGCSAANEVFWFANVRNRDGEGEAPLSVSSGFALQGVWKGEEVRLLFSSSPSTTELRGSEDCLCIRFRKQSPSLTVGFGNPFLYERNVELSLHHDQLHFWVCIDIARGWFIVGTSNSESGNEKQQMLKIEEEEGKIGQNVKIALKVEKHQLSSLCYMTATNWEYEAQLHITRFVPLRQSMKSYFRSQLKFDEEGNMKDIYGITSICVLKKEEVRTVVQQIRGHISSSPFLSSHFAFTSLQSLHMTVIDLLLLTPPLLPSIHSFLTHLNHQNDNNGNNDNDNEGGVGGGSEVDGKEVAIRLHRTAKRILEEKGLWQRFQEMTFSMRVDRLFINSRVVSLVVTPIDDTTADAIRNWRLMISDALDDLQYCNPADPHYVFHITIGYCFVPTFDDEFRGECEKLSSYFQPFIDTLPILHFSPPLLCYFTSMNSFISEF